MRLILDTIALAALALLSLAFCYAILSEAFSEPAYPAWCANLTPGECVAKAQERAARW